MSVTINHQTNSVEPSSGDLSIGGSGNVSINNEAIVDGDVTIDNRNRLRFADVGVDKALIGTHTGTRLYMGSEGTNSDPRIRFDGQATQAAIEPTLPSGSTGSGASGYLNLGSSTAGFKDLYLDGGVYLGGTGSANLLDDYETGTWTPVLTTGTASSQNFTYTKIGRAVHLTGYMHSLSGWPTSGIQQISGLPFTGAGNYQMWQLWHGGTSSAPTGLQATTYLADSSSQLQLRPEFGNPDDFNEFSVSLTYITNQ
jgi:hypothetical protein